MMNHNKAQLGNRYVCFQCGTKFYDLNRPEPLCPECQADQREAPPRDIKSLLSGGRRSNLSTTSSLSSSSDSDDDGDDYDDFGVNDDEDDDDGEGEGEGETEPDDE